jgi:hypothetical protein
MADHKILPLKPTPGIQRDLTQFDSTGYIDGQWVRFYKGYPRKIGGFQLLTPGSTEITRTLFSVKKSESFDLYMGRESGVTVTNYLVSGAASPEIDRTPLDYVPHENNQWSFELFNTQVDGVPTLLIFAHVAHKAHDISNTTNGELYYGDVNSTAPLTRVYQDSPTNLVPLIYNGGIVAVPPFLFAYGNGGVVSWSKSGNPLMWDDVDIASIAGTKIVAGWRTRGSTAPTVLFWSLDSLIRGTFISEDLGFSFNTIEDDISILSPRSIIKYDQVYYWVGADQFYYYNGVVQSITNTFSTDWFFNNLNKEQSAKVFGVSIRRYNEIWWFYPRGNATECTHAIIFNVKENIWYDTQLPRSHGISANLYTYPIMADSTTVINLDAEVDPETNQRPITYPIWTHEKGNNQILFNQIFAIRSSFETNIMDLFEQNGNDRQLRIRRIEPNFIQTGDMNVRVINRGFSQGDLQPSPLYTFSPDQSKIDMNEMGRLVSLKFTSDTQDGFYQMGKVLLNIAEGDVRPKS